MNKQPWIETYDVVMPILKRDWPAAQVNLPFVFKNLPIRRLVVLSGADLEPLLPRDERIVFVNENELMEGLTLASVKKAMYARIYTDKRAGWYFQQFLKLGYARVCTEKAYIVWDADTVPVRPISFQNEQGQYLFNVRPEYNKPYFDTMKTLLGLEKCQEDSFIAEHMIFDTQRACRMLDEIEANDRLPGTAFWEKILAAVPLDALKGSGFSEFETYGTWAMTRCPGRYEVRPLHGLRSGKNILGQAPDAETLEWVGQSYDTVAMEKFSASTPLRHLAASGRYRAGHTAVQLNALKERFHVIPAVYGWGRGLWPRFKIWGGKYKRMLRAKQTNKK